MDTPNTSPHCQPPDPAHPVYELYTVLRERQLDRDWPACLDKHGRQALCTRFGIEPATLWEWLGYIEEAGLMDVLVMASLNGDGRP
jgi:hypothetical protein